MKKTFITMTLTALLSLSLNIAYAHGTEQPTVSSKKPAAHKKHGNVATKEQEAGAGGTSVQGGPSEGSGTNTGQTVSQAAVESEADSTVHGTSDYSAASSQAYAHEMPSTNESPYQSIGDQPPMGDGQTNY